ncbi:putative glucuronosyltransferase [Canna indica]|uniref:Glycosyltransferases n=1 Tax=Canna indica TaxID=4628 RepID=A0AAQ3KVB0_9LILI|nr:putative glucuronosyltransferase [Canna indica]
MLQRSPALERAPLGLVSPLLLLRKSSVARGKKTAALSFSAFQGLPVPLPLDCCSKISSSDLVSSRDCFIWERASLSFVRQSREMAILMLAVLPQMDALLWRRVLLAGVCAAGFGMWSLHQVHAELDRELVGQLWNNMFNFLGCGSFGIGDPLHGPASRLASADHDLDPEGGLGQLGKAAGAASLACNFVDAAALMSRGGMTDRNAADPCINKAADCSFKMAEFSPYPAIISTGRGKGGVGGKKSAAVVRRSCRLLIKGSGQAATRAAKMKAARYDGNLGQSDPPPTIEDASSAGLGILSQIGVPRKFSVHQIWAEDNEGKRLYCPLADTALARRLTPRLSPLAQHRLLSPLSRPTLDARRSTPLASLTQRSFPCPPIDTPSAAVAGGGVPRRAEQDAEPSRGGAARDPHPAVGGPFPETMPEESRYRRHAEARMRLHALRVVRQRRMDGIVVFADDNNVHTVELFDEAQKVKWMGAISVGILTHTGRSRSGGGGEGGEVSYANPRPCLQLLWPLGRVAHLQPTAEHARYDSKFPSGWTIDPTLNITVAAKHTQWIDSPPELPSWTRYISQEHDVKQDSSTNTNRNK